MPSPVTHGTRPCYVCGERGRRMVKRPVGWVCKECAYALTQVDVTPERAGLR